MGALAHAHGVLPVRCGGACRGDGEGVAALRASWGCDGPARLPEGAAGVWSLPCSCGGRPGCAACKGTGRVWYDRCPAAVGCFDPWVIEVVRSLREYQAGILPAAGGTLDQARGWHGSLPSLLAWDSECATMAADRRRPPEE